jgi:hypothetical protein
LGHFANFQKDDIILPMRKFFTVLFRLPPGIIAIVMYIVFHSILFIFETAFVLISMPFVAMGNRHKDKFLDFYSFYPNWTNALEWGRTQYDYDMKGNPSNPRREYRINSFLEGLDRIIRMICDVR